jgi:hypothetical protein
MLEWVRYYDAGVAKTFLTQQSELGTTQTGSRAVGETFFEQLKRLVQADCEEIAGILNERLVKQMVDWNFGPQENYPTFQPSQRVSIKASGRAAARALITRRCCIRARGRSLRARCARPAAGRARDAAGRGGPPGDRCGDRRGHAEAGRSGAAQ